MIKEEERQKPFWEKLFWTLLLIILVGWCILKVTGVPYTLYQKLGTTAPRIFGPSGQRRVSPTYVHNHDYANICLDHGKGAWSRGEYDKAAHWFRAELGGPYYPTKNFADATARDSLKQLATIEAENAKAKSVTSTDKG